MVMVALFPLYESGLSEYPIMVVFLVIKTGPLYVPGCRNMVFPGLALTSACRSAPALATTAPAGGVVAARAVAAIAISREVIRMVDAVAIVGKNVGYRTNNKDRKGTTTKS